MLLFSGISKEANLDGIIVDEVSCDTTLDFFNDKRCVVTGSFKNIDKDNIAKIIIENGGKVQTSVSGRIY